MADTTDLAKQNYKDEIIAVDNSSFSSYLDTAKFTQIQRVANMFAASDMVPAHYQKKPANCALAIQMATRLEIDPMMFMQNSYVISGKPGLQAVIAIALVNSRGPFTGPIQWRFEGQGKTRQCTAYATHKITKEVCEATVTWTMVEAEGWNKKTGSKWNTLPDNMFRYRSASFLAKFYCPETILGLPTAEELEDIEAGDKYEPAPPKTGRIEKRLAKKEVQSQIVELTDNSERLAEAEKTAEDKFGEPINDDQRNQQIAQAEISAAEEAGKEAQSSAELAELNQFAQKPAEKPQKTTQEAVEPPKVDPSERYYCKHCDKATGKLAGLNKNLCPACLDAKHIIDRIPDKK